MNSKAQACRRARRMLALRFAGSLKLEAQFMLEGHVRHCADCLRLQANQDRILDGLGQLDEAPVERLDIEHSTARIRSRIEAEEEHEWEALEYSESATAAVLFDDLDDCDYSQEELWAPQFEVKEPFEVKEQGAFTKGARASKLPSKNLRSAAKPTGRLSMLLRLAASSSRSFPGSLSAAALVLAAIGLGFAIWGTFGQGLRGAGSEQAVANGVVNKVPEFDGGAAHDSDRAQTSPQVQVTQGMTAAAASSLSNNGRTSPFERASSSDSELAHRSQAMAFVELSPPDREMDRQRQQEMCSDLRSVVKAAALEASRGTVYTSANGDEVPVLGQGQALDLDPDKLLIHFDELAQGLDAEGWPLLRLLEPMTKDADDLVRAASMRILGRRGSSSARRMLVAALDREKDPAHAVRGLIDQGFAGLLEIAGLIAEAEWLLEIRIAVERLEADERLNWGQLHLKSALAFQTPAGLVLTKRAKRSNMENGLSAELQASAQSFAVDLLAGCGAAGVLHLLQLERRGELEIDAVLSSLAANASARATIEEAIGFEAQSASPPARAGSQLAWQQTQRQALSDLGKDVERLHPLVVALKPAGGTTWLRAIAADYDYLTLALDGLSKWGGVQAAQELLDLSPEAKSLGPLLDASWQASAANDPIAMVGLVGQLERMEAHSQAADMLEILIASCGANGVPALVSMAQSELLERADRERALLAAAELGRAEHAELLLPLFASFDTRERNLAAACLLAVHRLGADAQWLELISGADSVLRERIGALLSSSLDGRGTAVVLTRLARELDIYLDEESTRRRSMP